MSYPNPVKWIFGGAVAAVAMATAMNPIPAEAGIKQEVCSAIGCNEGQLDCADVDVNIDGDVWVIEAGGSVTFYCREDPQPE